MTKHANIWLGVQFRLNIDFKQVWANFWEFDVLVNMEHSWFTNQNVIYLEIVIQKLATLEHKNIKYTSTWFFSRNPRLTKGGLLQPALWFSPVALKR